VINNLNSKKSPGYDGISSQVATEISEPLSHVFNLTFLTGIIPDDLKIALKLPLFSRKTKRMNLKIIGPYLFSLVFLNY
jgi:hypothetical protein